MLFTHPSNKTCEASAILTLEGSVEVSAIICTRRSFLDPPASAPSAPERAAKPFPRTQSSFNTSASLLKPEQTVRERDQTLSALPSSASVNPLLLSFTMRTQETLNDAGATGYIVRTIELEEVGDVNLVPLCHLSSAKPFTDPMREQLCSLA